MNRLIPGLAGLLALTAIGRAQDILGSTFENRPDGTFVNGAPFTSGIPNRFWTASNLWFYSNERAESGSLSAKIQRGQGLGYTDASCVLNPPGNYPHGQFFTASVSIYIPTGPSNSAVFGLDVWNMDGAANIPQTGMRLRGDGSIVYWGPGTTTPSTLLLADQTYQKGAWNRLDVAYQFSAQFTGVVSYLLNGNPLTRGGNAASMNLNGLSAGVGGFAMLSDTFNGGGSPDNAIAYFDNLGISSGQPVPEPATLCTLALALLAVRRLSRKR